MQTSEKLLTVAIPTYNRAGFLEICLQALALQLPVLLKEVEVLVSDNHSTDTTQSVVEKYRANGVPISYILNNSNIGSDRNIAQCFNEAAGRYVLILGDDDVLLPGALLALVDRIKGDEYGIIYLQSYGYDIDYLREKPPRFINSDKVYYDKDKFLRKIAYRCTFISSNVINKSKIRQLNTENYIGTNLVQAYLILEALLASEKNLHMRRYMVACQRNNSGGFNFLSVFAGQLNRIFDAFTVRGFRQSTFRSINNRMLIEYYPYHLMKLRFADISGQQLRTEMRGYFASYPRYWLFVHPMLLMPRAMAWVWASVLILAGRIRQGELLRILAFVWNQCRRHG